MKITAFSVVAAAILPGVLAGPLVAKHEDVQCTTEYGLVSHKHVGTITAATRVHTVHETTGTTTEQKTKTEQKTEHVTKTKNKTHTTTYTHYKNAVTIEVTDTKSEITKTTVHDYTTITHTGKAKTLAAETTYPTIPAKSGFVPAASALASAEAKVNLRRNNKAEDVFPRSVICEATVSKTIKVEATETAQSDVTVHAKPTTIYSTQEIIHTKTKNKKVDDDKTHTITKTYTKTHLHTKTHTQTDTETATHHPTVTPSAVVIDHYAACDAYNLLDYTYASLSGSLNSTSNSTITPLYSNTTSSSSSTTKVNIYEVVSVAADITVISAAKSAYDCCALCIQDADCAGSSWAHEASVCKHYAGKTCKAQSAFSAGFFYAKPAGSSSSAELTISNGNCGEWAFGGQASASS